MVNLEDVAAAFVGWTTLSSDTEKSIVVLESTTVSSGRSENKPLNFMMIKLVFGQFLAVSVKVFSKPAFHFQIFGLMVRRDFVSGQDSRSNLFQDVGELKAAEIAQIILQFVADRITQRGLASLVVGDISVMSLSAKHLGISECGFKFDMAALESALQSICGVGTELTLTRNQRLIFSTPGFPLKNLCSWSRNHSLVVSKTGKKEGSQIFHATGCIQLMGWRGETDVVCHQLRELFLRFPLILIPANSSDMATNRKRRDRDAQAAKRSRTALATQKDLVAACSQSGMSTQECLGSDFTDLLEPSRSSDESLFDVPFEDAVDIIDHIVSCSSTSPRPFSFFDLPSPPSFF